MASHRKERIYPPNTVVERTQYDDLHQKYEDLRNFYDEELKENERLREENEILRNEIKNFIMKHNLDKLKDEYLVTLERQDNYIKALKCPYRNQLPCTRINNHMEVW